MDVKEKIKSKQHDNIEKFVFNLFVVGNMPRSLRAIYNVKKLCEENLDHDYSLEIHDIRMDLSLAQKEEVVAVPSLVRLFPLPQKIILGDCSDRKQVLKELGLLEVNNV